MCLPDSASVRCIDWLALDCFWPSLCATVRSNLDIFRIEEIELYFKWGHTWVWVSKHKRKKTQTIMKLHPNYIYILHWCFIYIILIIKKKKKREEEEEEEENFTVDGLVLTSEKWSSNELLHVQLFGYPICSKVRSLCRKRDPTFPPTQPTIDVFSKPLIWELSRGTYKWWLINHDQSV